MTINKTNKILYSILLFSFLGFSPKTISANNLDSLRMEINKCEMDTCRAILFYKIGQTQLRTDIDSAIVNVDKAFNLAKRSSFKKGICYSLILKASIFSRQKEFEKSDSIYNLLNQEIRESKSTYLSAMINYSVGNYYYRSNRIDSAIIYYTFCKNALTSEMPQYGETMISVLSNLGLMAKKKEEYNKALDFYKSAESFADSIEIKIPKRTYANLYNNIGSIYRITKDYDSALFFFKKAIQNAEKNSYVESTAQFNLSNIYFAQEKYDSAFDLSMILYKKEKGIAQKTKCKAINNIARCYLQLENIPLAKKYNLEQEDCINQKDNAGWVDFYFVRGMIYKKEGKPNEALLDLNKSLEISKKINNSIKDQISTLNHIILTSIAANEKEKSSVYFDTYVELQDSLNNILVSEAAQKWRINYDTKIKEDSLKILSQENIVQTLKSSQQIQQRNYGIGILGLIASILGFGAYSFFRRNKISEQHRLVLESKNKSIKILNRELSHRVKNNLQFISNLFRLQGRRMEDGLAKDTLKDSEQRLQTMSLIYKKLYQKEDGDISVDLPEYINELCQNLELTFTGNTKKLNIKTNIQPFQLDADDAANIGLMVNELVTNSVKHAFSEQKNPEVFVTINQNESGFSLEVIDNGNGSREKIISKNKSSFGLKLINILTEQLDGEMKVLQKTPGLQFQFDFKQ